MRRFLARLWLPRRDGEVALAVVLTVAAVGFMTLAMVRSGTADRPTQTAIRKPL